MNSELMNSLIFNETDVNGVLHRLSGDESFYETLLKAFIDDTTMDELESAIKEKKWDEAFTAAHALKGLAGNMGFTPLFHSIGELVILIRTGKINEIDTSYKIVKRYYENIVSAIKNNCQ